MSNELFDDMTFHKVTVYKLETLGKDDVISLDVEKDIDQIIDEEVDKLFRKIREKYEEGV